MKTPFIVFLLLLNTFVQAQQTDTIKITFPEKEMPEWLINSSYVVKPVVISNKYNEVFAFLTEQLYGVSGHDAIKAVKFSTDTKSVLEKNDILPLTAGITSIQTDKNGEIWLAVQEKQSEVLNSAIYHFNRDFELIQKLDMPTVYFPVAINWDSRGNMLLFTQADSVLKLWDKQVTLKKPRATGFQLSVIDSSLKTLKVVELEAVSHVLNDPAMIITHIDGSIYIIQNTTILSGPDHHEVHLWSFKDWKSVPVHRHLWGSGELEYLWVREASILDDGSLNIKGYSNDLVNFKDSKTFFRSDLTGKKKELVYDSLSYYSYIPPFAFDCVYSQKLQLLKYQENDTFPEFYSWMSRDFPEEGFLNLSNKKRVHFLSVPGRLNSSESPTFEMVIED